MLPSNNGFPRLASRLAWRFAAPLALCAGLLASAPASAASLTRSPPGGRWAPSRAGSRCTSTCPTTSRRTRRSSCSFTTAAETRRASSAEAQSGGIVTQADQKKILLVVPQTSRNCWDVGDRELPQARRRQQRHEGDRRQDQVRDRPETGEREPRLRHGRLVRRDGDAGDARDVSRRVQGRRRVRGRPRGMLVGRQHDRRAVELVVRERPGPAHPAGVGRHGSRHVPRVHRISPPHPALARVGGHHHQLRQLHRGRRPVDQRAGAARDADDDVDPVDRRPQLQSQAMERLLRDHGPRRV